MRVYDLCGTHTHTTLNTRKRSLCRCVRWKKQPISERPGKADIGTLTSGAPHNAHTHYTHYTDDTNDDLPRINNLFRSNCSTYLATIRPAHFTSNLHLFGQRPQKKLSSLSARGRSTNVISSARGRSTNVPYFFRLLPIRAQGLEQKPSFNLFGSSTGGRGDIFCHIVSARVRIFHPPSRCLHKYFDQALTKGKKNNGLRLLVTCHQKTYPVSP